ncbi:MAG: glycosyltransferase [Nitrososphaerota archaeon]|nr:glycosyltransferase [Nitrososphaerota archaeon]MDG7049172.1 glycosyltransferase [Nitrososphaerota archaeon]MDG7051187.1 glycosyltransferase [Nitrososphaerota archaeon]
MNLQAVELLAETAAPFKTTGRPLVSFVIPVGREGEGLASAMQEFVGQYNNVRSPVGAEFILATDIGDPSTGAAMAALSKAGVCRAFFLSTRIGKGGTIKNIVRFASGSIIVMLDADVPVHPSDIYQAIQMITDGRADLVVARRVKRWDGPTRAFLSVAYNLLVRMFFRTGVADHQAGFKVAKAEVLRGSLSYIRTDGLGFDTELIVWAKRLKIRISNIEVEWRDSKYKISSNIIPLKALLTMLADLVVLRITTLKEGMDLVLRTVGSVFDEDGKYVGPEYITMLNAGNQSIMGLLRKLYATVAFR